MTDELERVRVWRGKHSPDVPLFGPLPGVRLGDVLAYEFELPDQFVPWRDSLVQRTFVLLELGVAMNVPVWRELRRPGQAPVVGLDESTSWYVDLLLVEQEGIDYVVRDLYVDAIVPMDGRPFRVIDLDDFAAALQAGAIDVDAAAGALRRWQRFLDAHLQGGRAFPPKEIAPLAALAEPLAPPVRWDPS